MTQNYLVNLNCDNKEYSTAKDEAWSKLLDARTAVSKMGNALIKSGMTKEDWAAFEEVEKLYDSMSKMLNKINHKF